MYTTRPKLPKQIAEKYETILQALNGAMPVTEAAEKLGISAVQCHNLLNRAAAGVLESLLPRKPGRKPSPERERKLEEEAKQLPAREPTAAGADGDDRPADDGSGRNPARADPAGADEEEEIVVEWSE